MHYLKNLLAPELFMKGRDTARYV
ncbi:protein of unknown function [Candidatus Methylomirabilis oxygeniifera]|uniref:Uncharacterized protein n=1 Tax=Methylomirabilis oxygeniifera TaxID=671143 RepID=D5MJA6_METO1|nr:protein of unknown function [Candidatus Methylomirabilis oxyfera]